MLRTDPPENDDVTMARNIIIRLRMTAPTTEQWPQNPIDVIGPLQDNPHRRERWILEKSTWSNVKHNNTYLF